MQGNKGKRGIITNVGRKEEMRAFSQLAHFLFDHSMDLIGKG